jgi:glycosyltransferase involved in cell wall biosynthesis
MSGQKLRMCIVTPRQYGGGAEYQISLLIDALLESARYDIHLLVRHFDERIEQIGYHVVRIRRSGEVPRFGYIGDLVPLYRALRRIKPNILYQRVACGYTGICALYARREHVPLLWHAAHDTDVSPATLDRGRNFLRRRLEKWSVEYGIRHADRIVVQTRQQGELLLRHYGRRADAVIPNFHGDAGERIDKSGPTTVVWVANLKSWKRPEVFVRLALALQDVPGLQFIMLGEAPAGTSNQGWLAPLMRSIEAAPNVRYLGSRSQREVNEIFAKATIFVNTSVHEGFPNTFIQAWQRDVAVVSLDVNPDDVLQREGVGIHAGSEQALSEAVRMLVMMPWVRAGYVERAREYVRSQHSLRNSAMLVQLIDSLTQPEQGGVGAGCDARV